MSIRGTTAAPIGAAIDADVLASYWANFVQRAHRLIAEGFEQLDAAALATVGEEDISAMIIDGIRQFYDATDREPWMELYSYGNEGPVPTPGRAGKKAPRIDIYFRSYPSYSSRGREIWMMFEAKRIYRSNSVAEYLGEDGLGAFLDGTYAHDARAAAMLAYVQKPEFGDAMSRIETKLDRERSTHCLAPDGPVWCSDVQDSRLSSTMRSRHNRAKFGLLDIYHSFLKCY